MALRPNGVFYCSKYPTKANWRVADNKLTVEFGKYGNYEFTLPAGGDGSIDGRALDNQANWRKLTHKRNFNPTETLLLGEHGYGSVWNFEYAKGSFEIEFRCDAYNHFVCKTYPSHSHWLNTDDGLVQIFWGKYGKSRLVKLVNAFILAFIRQVYKQLSHLPIYIYSKCPHIRTFILILHTYA